MSGFQLLRLTVPATAEELAVAELWAAGTLGLETRAGAADELRILAYFADPEAAAAGAARISAVLGPVQPELSVEEERDWLAEYRRRARPFALGTRLEIDPGEPDAGGGPGPPPGRARLRLPARRAFGTGEHPTTRLMIESLEELDLEGLEVLDLGAGSGILSFAARLWGARQVTALEIDPVAAWTARENQILNGIDFPVVAGRAGCLRLRPGFDLALVNVLPQRVRPDLVDLAALLRPGATALFSGILAEQAEGVGGELEARGFQPLSRRRSEEWVVLATRIAAASGAGREATAW